MYTKWSPLMEVCALRVLIVFKILVSSHNSGYLQTNDAFFTTIIISVRNNNNSNITNIITKLTYKRC